MTTEIKRKITSSAESVSFLWLSVKLAMFCYCADFVAVRIVTILSHSKPAIAETNDEINIAIFDSV